MNYTYTDAVNMLQNGQAAKRASWRGYVKKHVNEDGSYELVYMKKDGTQAVYAVNAEGVMACTIPLTLTAELNSDILSNDWMIGSAADFEQARTGEGTGEF